MAVSASGRLLALGSLAAGGVAGVSERIPVDPDPATARDWLRRVLAGAEYQRARPSLAELIGQWIRDRLADLTLPTAPGGPPAIVVFIPIVLVVGAIVTALIVYGVPRLRRRTKGSGELFGAGDDRSATDLRREAAAAARAGDFSRAVIEQFRALSRALADRTVVSVSPGTTAFGVARNAGAVFPASAPDLLVGAAAFDRVRYLGGDGTRDEWQELVALDRRLEAATPTLDRAPLVGDPVGTGGGRS